MKKQMALVLVPVALASHACVPNQIDSDGTGVRLNVNRNTTDIITTIPEQCELSALYEQARREQLTNDLVNTCKASREAFEQKVSVSDILVRPGELEVDPKPEEGVSLYFWDTGNGKTFSFWCSQGRVIVEFTTGAETPEVDTDIIRMDSGLAYCPQQEADIKETIQEAEKIRENIYREFQALPTPEWAK
jgi:hypothetical protein